MAILAPAKCPICGCPTINMQVITWGVFRAGKFETFEIGESISYLEKAVAVCDNDDCGTEWEWEQIP